MTSSSEASRLKRVEQPGSSSFARYAVLSVAALALLYALFAGLHTVDDPDLGWQLATGRWIVQHHSIPYTDVLSYTAAGREWIYPVLSQILLYGTYALGGYTLLSWLGAAATVGLIALLLRKGKTAAILLAFLAVPLVAARTTPRAEMFSELLLAAFVSILWHYHRDGRGPLWLLPVLMGLWVNLHPGFIAGLGMCVAYLVLEAGEGVWHGWAQPVARLRRAGPWLAGAATATLLNPWGARLFVALARQDKASQLHKLWIDEWRPMRFTVLTLGDAFDLRSPTSAVYWLMAITVVAIVLAVAMRRFAPALLLAVSIGCVISASRLQCAFAVVAVIIGGSILEEEASRLGWLRGAVSRWGQATLISVSLAILALASVRIWDLASNRLYLSRASTMYFGTGLASWVPEGGTEFIKREQLPAEVYSDYGTGGFVAWGLGSGYRDFIDGRAIPFGPELFIQSAGLEGVPLDSEPWRRMADQWGIRTIVRSVDFAMGTGGLTTFASSCGSTQWKLVYLDTETAVYLRVQPETQPLIQRLQIDCASLHFDQPPAGSGSRRQAERFNYEVNGASLLVQLNRPAEALERLEDAQKIFDDSFALHYSKGIALLQLRRDSEGEQQLRRAVDLGSVEAARSLAMFYEQRGRFADQAAVLEHAADRSTYAPYLIYLELGHAQTLMGRPDLALESLRKAEEESPFVGEAAAYGAEFQQSLAQARDEALRARTGGSFPIQ